MKRATEVIFWTVLVLAALAACVAVLVALGYNPFN